MGKGGGKREEIGDGGDAQGLGFFEGEIVEKEPVSGKEKVVTEKEEGFFKYSKKVPTKDVEGDREEPYVLTWNSELHPRWDGPSGTTILKDKPKGELLSSLYFFLLLVMLVILWFKLLPLF